MWLKEHVNRHRYPLRRRVRYSELKRWRNTMQAIRDMPLDPCILLSYWGPLCYRCPRPALWYRTRYIWHGKVYKWERGVHA